MSAATATDPASAGASPRKRPRWRRALRAGLRFVAHVAIVGGVLLVLEAGLTFAWQEPVSALLTGRAQAQLRVDLERSLESTETADRARRQDLRALAKRYGAQAEEGGALGEIEIPSIGVSYAMVEGTESGSLRKGPGHYSRTVLPGQRGTFGVAGHRTTYGAPFREINKLEPGDRIIIRMPYGRFVYRVQGTKIVDPSETSVLDDVGYDRAVLTACHPLYSAAQRIIVFSRLIRSPAGPAQSASR